MRTCRLFMWLILMALVVGMSAAVAKADGDPSGKLQAPVIGGTPTVDNEFSLAPFGQTSTGCTFDGTNEDCVLKNGSNTNWTWASITAGQAVPCDEVNFTTDLFAAVSCKNDPITGDPTITVSGVNYSPSTNALLATVSGALGACDPGSNPSCTIPNIQTFELSNPLFAPNCQPSGSYLPGVLIGCDFEFELGPGPDGNWDPNTPFNVVAPEPSTLAMLLTGLVGLPFAVRRRKSIIAA
jgi:hypothetical protein